MKMEFTSVCLGFGIRQDNTNLTKSLRLVKFCTFLFFFFPFITFRFRCLIGIDFEILVLRISFVGISVTTVVNYYLSSGNKEKGKYGDGRS